MEAIIQWKPATHCGTDTQVLIAYMGDTQVKNLLLKNLKQ